MSIKAVLIDLGDTLAYIDEEEIESYRRSLLKVMQKHGYQGSLEGFATEFDHVIRNSMKGEVSNLHEFWGVLVKTLGIQADEGSMFEELEDIRRIHSPGLFKLFNGALTVLTDLLKKYRLALVSNCAIGTAENIEYLNLTPFFECIVLSYEVGSRKPAKPIYLEALRCLSMKGSDCIFVADEISDLEGARDLGMKTFLVRQGKYTTHEAKDVNFKPDYECTHIAEVSNFL
ncbi:MAG: HAD-IA family hydrolase [Candidatus Bathyarchaeota archaeon]|nr:MAG: HAD-IA family hydrolase [Candidatus Bathyarchaeota archaeon]